MRLNTNFDKLKGFTLVELMIVVAIISILAAVALPSYQAYIDQSNRAAVKAILHENAQFMEQFYTENSRYDRTIADVAVTLPILQSPRVGTAQYNVSLQAAANATFMLQAVPTGGMTGDMCGTYTLTNTGVQGAGGTVADCWNR